MNREDLDEFFARAEDVLLEWYGSDDAMNTADPDPLPCGGIPADDDPAWVSLPSGEVNLSFTVISPRDLVYLRSVDHHPGSAVDLYYGLLNGDN